MGHLILGGELKQVMKNKMIRQMKNGHNLREEISMNITIRVFLLMSLFILTISGFSINTHAQIGLNNLFCPHNPISDGMLYLQITPSETNPAKFSAGMIGMFKSTGNASGGLDWMTTRGVSSSGVTSAPTNELGTQLISWWTRTDNRNTHIQVTNHGDGTGPHTSEGLKVHVHIFSSDCIEVMDFCDTYTPSDTHVYDLSNLVTNTGTPISTTFLADKEGTITVTPVDMCLGVIGDEHAIEHNFLSGNVTISDSLDSTDGTPHGYAYGTNMYARRAICNAPRCTGLLDGSSNARLDTILPDEVFGLFNTDTASTGSDAVVMSFLDDYGPPYLPRMAPSNYEAFIFDNNENAFSCGVAEACFLRLGIDSSLPSRYDFTGP